MFNQHTWTLPILYLFNKANHNTAISTLITLTVLLQMIFFYSLSDIQYSWLDNTTIRKASHLFSLYCATYSRPSISLYQLKIQIGA